jgi:hypothetical protein
MHKSKEMRMKMIASVNSCKKFWTKLTNQDMISIMGDFSTRVGNIKMHTNFGPNGENTCNRNGK